MGQNGLETGDQKQAQPNQAAPERPDFSQYVIAKSMPGPAVTADGLLDKPTSGAAVAAFVADQSKADAANARHSYLDTGVNAITKNFIADGQTRDTVNHYTGEFLKTAALFTPGKIGVIGTVALSGLAQASPSDSLSLQAEDFALGAAKGGTVRAAFSVVGKNFTFAPTKGILIGTASRASEAFFQRDLFTDPTAVQKRLGHELINPTAWAFDATVFGVGEGLFAAGNKLSAGRLAANKTLGSMSMGASFGIVGGGVGEITRQQQAGENFDAGKVLQRSLIQGGLDALAGGVGAKVGDWQLRRTLPADLEVPKGQMREFIITDGKDKLAAFRRNEAEDATIQVRGKNWWNFGEKTMFIQRLDATEHVLKPEAAKADVIVTCHPENLSEADRARHLFGDKSGRVWLMEGAKDRIALSTENVPISLWRAKGYNEPVRLDFGQTTINVMSPLLIGDPHNPNAEASKGEWERFDADLKKAKELGIDGVSTDVWWGIVEREQGKFDWSYYDRVAKHITEAGMKWVPILSFHKAGGNVGDTVNVNLPEWIWKTAQERAASTNPDVAKFVSEQNHASDEYVSFWGTNLVLDKYANVMRNFQSHYANQAANISEVNISLGPSGELRMPSYNSHDTGTGWPTRGALQVYSDLAKESFRDYVVARYGSVEAVGRAWGIKDLTRQNILPPSDPNVFYNTKAYQNSQYGRDLYDFNNQSVMNHGRMMLGSAINIFGAKDAPFNGIEIGAKIPGVHWRVGSMEGDHVVFGDRLAELNAGLIRTSRNDWNSDEAGRGYRPILSMFKEMQPLIPGRGSRVVPVFTALEMPDGADGPAVQSLPNSLAKWVGQEARRQGMTIRGENALAGNLGSGYNWDIVHGLLDLPNQPGQYNGITFLRMGDVVNNSTARAKLSEIIYAIRSIEPQRKAG